MDSGLAGGSAPWTPGGYIPVASINILFIPVPNILFIPVSHILFIPVSSTFFIPVPYILFIPVANTLFISVNHIFFIPVSSTFFISASHIFLSQSATHSLSQFYIFQFYIHPYFSCFQNPNYLGQIFMSVFPLIHYINKNHISIIISSLSLVFSPLLSWYYLSSLFLPIIFYHHPHFYL